MITAEISGARNIGMRNQEGDALREITMIITEDAAVAFRIGQTVYITTMDERTTDLIDEAVRGTEERWDS